MSNYRNVLVAVDLNPDNQPVIDKAIELAKMNNAILHVIHVVEPLSYGYSDGMMSWSDGLISVEAAIREDARKRLSEMGRRYEIDDQHLYFRPGRASSEIHDIVDEMGIDLIVIGTHGQAGLQLLLGSTANSVLHGSVCDVLAVRIK